MPFTGQCSAIAGTSASVRRTTKIAPPTTTAMCSPEIESRCASPESRIACAVGKGMAPWSPVTNAAAIAPASPGTAAMMRSVNRRRAPSSHASAPAGGGAGVVMASGPIG